MRTKDETNLWIELWTLMVGREMAYGQEVTSSTAIVRVQHSFGRF